jgi:hypothetical protein
MIYHQNFVLMSTALIKVCLFWRPVLFLCSVKIKGHLPISSLEKAVTCMDVKQTNHHYLQTDAEQLNIFKEGHKVNLNDSTTLQRIHKELAHTIFSDVCIIQR